MSASNEKKDRRSAEREQEEKERRSLRIKVIAVVAVLVLMAAFVLFFNSSFLNTHGTAVSINGTSYSAADFNYFYVSAYNQYYTQYEQMYNYYGDYVSYFMSLPTSGSSFREQAYSDTQTWAEYFEESALSNMQAVTALCDAAEAEGFTLTDEDLAGIDSDIESLEESVKSADSSYYSDLSSYLRFMYGKGMTESVYRKNVERMLLASNYSASKEESFTFTDTELSDYYAEHKDEYDYITYRTYFISATLDEDDEETEEDEAAASFDDAMMVAEMNAEAFLEDMENGSSFVEVAASFDSISVDEVSDATTAQGSSLSSDYSEWLLDSSRVEGDVTSIAVGTEEDYSGAGYYIVYFIERDDNNYNTRNLYYIRKAAETVSEEDYETTEEYEFALTAAESSAEEYIDELLDEYNSSASTGMDAMESLYETHVDDVDEGGELTEIGKHSLVESMAEWLFDDSRVEGDVGTIYDESYGWFLVYYNGEGDTNANVLANTDMLDEAYDEWYDGLVEPYTSETGWTMRFTTKITALGG